MRLGEPLLLDEMFSPGLTEWLCAEGYDVLAVAGHPVLGSAADLQVAAWATREGRRVVTENVRDLAPLAGHGDSPLRVLFTSPLRFPRSRRNPGPLLKALRAWLDEPLSHPPVSWLH